MSSLFSKNKSLPLLPEDIMKEEILTRVPMESLVRFRCVCKSWKILLSSNPSFAKSQLAHRKDSNNAKVIVKCGATSIYKYNLLHLLNSKYLKVAGSVNGLVICRAQTNSVYHYLPNSIPFIGIWNPATRQYKQIVTPFKASHIPGNSYISIDFGFDPVSDDYKVIFIIMSYDCPLPLVVDVYSSSCNSWPIFQLDVKSAFLQGDLEEEVFVDQPPGYVKSGSEHKVYRLKKALYGLKQAPRAWYSRIDAYFLKEGFKRCPYEHTLYTKIGDDGKLVIVCLYVDDLIYTGNDSAMIEKFKQSMMHEFDMSDLGMMHYFLGIKVVQPDSGIFLCQKKYVQEVLGRFGMLYCNSVTTPAEKGVRLTKESAGREVDRVLFTRISLEA
ncbi:hypothetical protein POM88_008325 [Heracleum sosnowskyi]|uniref:F-box domain-containing protein n=1 Tax=Heracleum sosnowskyi TaxID=360622 RepID=A0AAD8N746_9APIA|nr:hypothetical protein POM88_008325 [Heracleum sosnowskyi]